MILLIAAAIAAAAPGRRPRRACPNLVTAAGVRLPRARRRRRPATPRPRRRRSSKRLWPTAEDPATARMCAAAGNMWIAAGQPGKAAVALDKALARPGLDAEQRGEALLDRARAAEAQNDLKSARAKLNRSRGDHLRRSLLLVFLGRAGVRERDEATAQVAIGRALTLGAGRPVDPVRGRPRRAFRRRRRQGARLLDTAPSRRIPAGRSARRHGTRSPAPRAAHR